MSAGLCPPRLAERLIENVLWTSDQRHGVIGDLREEYARRRAKYGRVRCDLWYWREAWALRLKFRSELRRMKRENAGHRIPQAVGGLGQDIRYALRGLLRTKAFTGVAVLSLAAGVGINTVLFTLFHATWLQRIPGISGEDRAVEVLITSRGREMQEWSYLDFKEVRDAKTPIEALAGWKDRIGTLTTLDGGQSVSLTYVSSDYFGVLGVTMARGRAFLAAEDGGPGQHRVAIVSHRIWQERLGADQDILGRTITLNRVPYTVVGVADRAFRGHRPLDAGTDMWVPLVQHPYIAEERNLADDRGAQWLQVLGRLRSGTTIGEANAALSAVFARPDKEYPETNEARGAQAHPLGPIPALGRAGSRMATASVLVLAGVILLIICGNLAGMVLARNATRDREIAVRLALGSGRARLVRHLMVEAILLAIAGGGLGTFAAFSATDLASAIMRFDFPLPGIVRPNIAIVAFTLLLIFGAALVFGLFPAMRFSRSDLISSLKDDSGSGGRRVGRIHRLAVSAQTGVAFLFLVLCGLWLRALGVMERRDLGFEPTGLLVTGMDLSLEGYQTPHDGIAFLDRVSEAVSAVPGVVSVAVSDGIPLDQVGNYTSVSRADRPDEPAGRVSVEFTRATEGFFETIGVPVREGRGFEAADAASSEPVVVVTSSLAQRLWPGEGAVGRQLSIRLGTDSIRAYTVVGVVGHTASSRATEDWPQVFFALRQTYYPRVMIVTKGAMDAASLVGPVRAAILEADPGLPMPEFVVGESLVARATRDQRLNAGAAGGLGLLALILSAIGVYGVAAFAVTSRSREIGLRMAMGASRDHVLRSVLKDAVRLAVPGLMVGALLAVATAFSMQRFLLGVSPADPICLAGAAFVLFLVVLLASVVPARRASTVDPMHALRRE